MQSKQRQAKIKKRNRKNDKIVKESKRKNR